MARMREPAAPPPRRLDGPVPPELAVGPLADVWSDGADLITAHRNHGNARRAWEATAGLDRHTSYGLLPGSSPWRLSDAAGPARLARYGVSAAAIPDLRAAALARVAALPNPNHRRTT